MLVLRRRKDEKIIIGEGEDQVMVQVVEIREGSVKLGIVAAEHIPVNREEVWKAVESEKRDGAQNHAADQI